MKWIALALIILAAPAIIAWLRTSPRGAPNVWALLTFLPFVVGPWHLEVAPFATPMWSGYVKGWEVSFLDAVAIGVIFGTRGHRPRMILVLPLLAYLMAVFLAVFQARFPNLALSYLIQFVRVGLVFLAISRVAAMERGERALLIGLFLGLAVQAGYAIVARAGGALQTGGSLGHQNLLGFVSHMALMPAFALLLSGKMPRWALLGTLSGIVVVILTASRATIAIAGFGLILTLILSLSIRATGRKAAVAVAGLFILLASYPLAYAALERRFAVQNTTFLAEDQEREAFEKAAHMIIAANPLGIGPNHYVFVANTEGYSDRAGVSWVTSSRSTQVHNSLLLVWAETGLFGLVSLAALFLSAIFYALKGAFRFRRESGSELLVGLGVALIAVILHGLVEWMFVVSPTQYTFAGTLGIITGLRSRFLAKAAAKHRNAARSRAEAGRVLAPGFATAAMTSVSFGQRL